MKKYIYAWKSELVNEFTTLNVSFDEPEKAAQLVGRDMKKDIKKIKEGKEYKLFFVGVLDDETGVITQDKVELIFDVAPLYAQVVALEAAQKEKKDV